MSSKRYCFKAKYPFKMESRRVDFTNIKCSSFDRNYSDFEYCYIKAVNRTMKHVSLKALLLQGPVNQFKVSLKF